MDTISALHRPIKVESPPISIPTPIPPSSESNLTNQEQSDMTNTHTVDIPLPPFINSINELRSLSTALSTFLRRYDELHNHLNSIKSSIDSKLSNHHLYTPNPNQSTLTPLIKTSSDQTITTVPETMVSEQNPNGTASNCERSHEIVTTPESPNHPKKPEETDISTEPEESDALTKPEETDNSKESEETDDSKKPEEIDISKKRDVSEIESYCEKMCGKDMKKYVASHISDMNKLREEIPKALKLAKDPAKLVLDSIGRFFVQGSRAYSKDTRMVVGRLASVVILECFVMISSDGIEIAKGDEKYAAEAAVAWRKRMINEGGMGKTDEADARGLLLLISGFGIPKGVFKNEDIRDLIMVSNVKEISIALRRSIILIPRIPEVIDWMVKNRQEIEAADIAYTFGLEDKCHPQIILTMFLHNIIKDKQHGSSSQVIEATKKQLSDLKSIKKCLEAHKLDAAKLFPEFKINEKIQELEKEMNELDLKSAEEKASRKRKGKEAASLRKPNHQEPKRNRLNSPKNKPQEHKSNNHYSKSPYHFNQNLPSEYISTYSTSSVYGKTYADQMVNATNGQPYERYLPLGQSYSRQVQPYDPQPSTSGLFGLYNRQSGGSSLESFPGLLSSSPSAGFSGRSDLYSFADRVDKTESYRATRASGSGTMRSSNLY